MKLYTPAHHEVLDTLIMYGLTKTINCAYPTLRFDIISSGVQYVLELHDELDSKIIDRKRDELFEELTNGSNISYFRELTQSYRVITTSDVTRLEPNFENRYYWVSRLNKLKEAKVVSTFTSYSKKDHRLYEGRLGSSGETAGLPILPIAGKFRPYLFKYEAKSYKLCSGCQMYANIGLNTLSQSIATRQQGFILCLRPLIRATNHDVALLENFGETRHSRIFKNVTDAPIYALCMAVLAVGETLLSFSPGSWWEFLGFSLKVEQRAAAIRDYKRLPANSIIRFFSLAKEKSGMISSLILTLLGDKDGRMLLSKWAQALAYRDSSALQSTLRSIKRLLLRPDVKKERLLDRDTIISSFKAIMH